MIGGRYGLGSKEFTPAMAHAVFEELAHAQKHDLEHVHRDLDVRPHRHFTVGIDDDVSATSLDFDPTWRVPRRDVSCLFYGLGSDGTVGANKNSAKIIAEEAGRYVQAYFVYDSKKSGAVTVSHLRFGDDPIDAPYLIEEADFVACHQFQLLERLDVLEHARQGATVLLSGPFGADSWRRLPRVVQEQIVEKQLRLYVVDAKRVAREAGLAGRVNTVLQTCFFSLSGVLPVDEAIAAIKQAIEKSYGRKGEELVRRNFAAVDGALAALQEVEPGALDGSAGPRASRRRATRAADAVSAATATGCRSALPIRRDSSRPARRTTSSAPWPTSCPSGIRRSASTARSARSSARTRRSA